MLTSQKFLKDSKCQSVVYHGTSRAFKHFFKTGPFGFARASTEGGKLAKNRQMFFFTDNPDVAASFAGKVKRGKQNAGPNVIPAYLSLKTPLIIDAHGENWFTTYNDVISAYDSGKYDGVILLNTEDHKTTITGNLSNVFVVFSNVQIMGAICHEVLGFEEDVQLLVA